MSWYRRLRIADIALDICVRGLSPESTAKLTRKYGPFERLEGDADYSITIQRDPDLPEVDNAAPAIAADDSGTLMLRSRGVDGTWAGNEIRARIANDLTFPVENVIRFVVTRTLLAQGGGAFHAVAFEVKDGSAAYLVLGESEAGKTTLANIIGRQHILSDEMPAITPNERGWRVHATPFWGDMAYGSNTASLPLDGVFVLEGKGELALRALSSIEAQQAALARVFNYSTEADQAEAAFELARSLSNSLSVLGLAYPKDIERADLLRALTDALDLNELKT